MGTYNVHAGHNYIVTGANGYLSETKENRVVKDKVIALLRAQGHTVYDCTDEDGKTQSKNLSNIVAKCNAHNVDLDVSIHFNAFNGTAHGVEVYYYSHKDVSARVSANIANTLNLTNRGAKQRTNLYVLSNTKAPAILVECLFCDNKGDTDKYNPDIIAREIVEGILNITIPDAAPAPITTELYRVRKTWEDTKSQLGAFKELENAKAACEVGYTVFDWNGKAVYSNNPTPVVEQLYRVRKTWADAASQVGAYKELDNAKASCPEGYTVFDSEGKAVYVNTPEPVVVVEQLYRVRKSWDDVKSQIGAYKTLDAAKKNCPSGYKVYDWDGKEVYANNADTSATVNSELYRVRKSWDDPSSQIGAYKELDNAKAACKAGYSVFDWNGVVVYVAGDDAKEASKNETPVAPEAEDISPLKGLNKDAFLEYMGQMAREDMKKTGVLASVTIAQSILESAWGQSELSLKANNLFGMKASLSGNTWNSDWDGKIYAKRTNEEYETGVITSVLADFRAYDDPAKSIKDHSDYLCGAKKGSELRYAGLKGEKDYKKAIQIIKDGGYATDSKYVDKIISYIEKYNLDMWDMEMSPSDGEPDVEEEVTPVVPTPEEKPEEVTPVTPEPEVKPEVEPEKDDKDDTLEDIKDNTNLILKIVQAIFDLLSKIFK